MAKRKMWTMLGLLVIVSLAWTAFVKPEQDRKQQALADSGVVAGTRMLITSQALPSRQSLKFLDGTQTVLGFHRLPKCDFRTLHNDCGRAGLYLPCDKV
ncbi:MAG: hypothetical protein U5L72_19925 [Bacteroidales bacterium]|nr:hypothetical protein [Bacteroidales bacterium]